MASGTGNIGGTSVDYPLGWPVLPAVQVTRERLLPTGRGALMIAVDDHVEPLQPIAQGNGSPLLLAGLRGRVTRIVPERGAVIEGSVTAIQGLFGFGAEVVGPIVHFPVGNVQAASLVKPGSILVIPGPLTDEILFAAIAGHAAGGFAASAQPQPIKTLTRAEPTALVDGTQPPAADLPITVVLAHGFGEHQLAREIWQILGAAAGHIALLAPATNIQRNQRPELLIPLPAQVSAPAGPADISLKAGMAVWTVGGTHDGAPGHIIRLLSSGQVMPSGIRTRAALVHLTSGADVVLPLTNLQRIG